MRNLTNKKKGFLLGITSIILAILIGIIFRHDVAFIFCGVGIIIIGVTILMHLNRR